MGKWWWTGMVNTVGGQLVELAGRLTERDRAVVRLLNEHRALTTAQGRDGGDGGA